MPQLKSAVVWINLASELEVYVIGNKAKSKIEAVILHAELKRFIQIVFVVPNRRILLFMIHQNVYARNCIRTSH